MGGRWAGSQCDRGTLESWPRSEALRWFSVRFPVPDVLFIPGYRWRGGGGGRRYGGGMEDHLLLLGVSRLS